MPEPHPASIKSGSRRLGPEMLLIFKKFYRWVLYVTKLRSSALIFQLIAGSLGQLLPLWPMSPWWGKLVLGINFYCKRINICSSTLNHVYYCTAHTRTPNIAEWWLFLESDHRKLSLICKMGLKITPINTSDSCYENQIIHIKCVTESLTHNRYSINVSYY